MPNTPPPLWQPSKDFIEQSQLRQYERWLQVEKGLEFENYHELWQWSVDHIEDFWESIWQYFDVQAHSPYQSILMGDEMPDYQWFTGSTLNYAEHIFRQRTNDHPAIIFQSERHPLTEMSWDELYEKTAALAAHLKSIGVQKGDRVVAFLPNIPEATIAFLATCSIGAIWSSCSPDFGVNSVVDRFQQIEPKVLIAVDGYQYGGKAFAKMDVVESLVQQLPTLEQVILLPYLEDEVNLTTVPKSITWQDALSQKAELLEFEAVPFDYPIWVLYSSGTTGIPKAITHSQGGALLEHFKYLALHNDVHPGERFFWFSTTGWMMWNFVQASLLVGATVVLYDGSPGYPDLNVLWQFAEQAKIHHFGTSAPFIIACMKRELSPKGSFDLSHLKSIGSTGAPLPPEGFDWVYENVSPEVWLCSMSGGTDVCTAFVGGCPTRPVYEGEIQCRALGCSMYAFDENGEPLQDEVGEMVITKPMPSMPIYFWNDEGKERYRDSYFDMFPGIWRHGDWLKITPRDTLLILGRSDATLNRQGVRIGTAEIYRTLHKINGIEDSLIVNLELPNGDHYMPLFVVLPKGQPLSPTLRQAITTKLKQDCSPRHVPDEIIAIPEVPYTMSGKKLEAPVKKILLGHTVGKAANKDAMKNPDALDFFVNFAKTLEERF